MKKRKVNRLINITAGITLDGYSEVSKHIVKAEKAMPRKDLVEGQVDVVVSNSALDRHGEKIMVQGIDTTQVERNPVVLFAHDYQSLPVGKIEKFWMDGKNLMARLTFAINDYDFAATLYKMVLGGFLNAVSIGGIVREWNQDQTVILKMEMVELSVVPVGAHPDALVVGKSFKKSLGVGREELAKQYSDFASRAFALDKLKGISENDRNKYINSLKELLSLLESVKVAEPIEAKSIQETRVKRIVLH